MRDKLGITSASVATFDRSLEIYDAFVVSSRCEDFDDVFAFVVVVLLVDKREFHFLLEGPTKERVMISFQELDVYRYTGT